MFFQIFFHPLYAAQTINVSSYTDADALGYHIGQLDGAIDIAFSDRMLKPCVEAAAGHYGPELITNDPHPDHLAITLPPSVYYKRSTEYLRGFSKFIVEMKNYFDPLRQDGSYLGQLLRYFPGIQSLTIYLPLRNNTYPNLLQDFEETCPLMNTLESFRISGAISGSKKEIEALAAILHHKMPYLKELEIKGDIISAWLNPLSAGISHLPYLMSLSWDKDYCSTLAKHKEILATNLSSLPHLRFISLGAGFNTTDIKSLAIDLSKKSETKDYIIKGRTIVKITR